MKGEELEAMETYLMQKGNMDQREKELVHELKTKLQSE